MFGLMKAHCGSRTDEFKLHRRLHYCGTCKTLGRLYGHQARLLLNHDTVFLAEILSAISTPDQDLKSWHRAYQSFNCLALPGNPVAMPLALQFAATATVVLVEFKIADQLTDSKRFIWKMARQVFSKDFRQARAHLKTWQFPFSQLQKVLRSQESREARAAQAQQSAADILNDLADPTAIATAMFSRHGARLVDKPETEPALYEFGYHFGRLIYWLDAFEDYEKDLRKGEFNAIRAAYRIANSDLPQAKIQPQITDLKMPDAVYGEMVGKLRALVQQVELAIRALPLPDPFVELFTARLRANSSRKIGALPVVEPTCRTPAQPGLSRLSLAERLRRAFDFSKQLAIQQQPTRRASRLAAPLVFASVLPIAFFNPQQAAMATSYRECLSLAFNLMFFGAAINTLGAIMNSLFLPPMRRAENLFASLMPPNRFDEQSGVDLNEAANQFAAKRRQRSPQDSGGCCDCLSDCGAGCCEGGCDCGCDCCCDNCDCCGCDCN